MHDPAAYITPDCVLDVSAVTFRQVEKDRVALNGARGKPRTPTYKVVVGYFDGYMGSARWALPASMRSPGAGRLNRQPRPFAAFGCP